MGHLKYIYRARCVYWPYPLVKFLMGQITWPDRVLHVAIKKILSMHISETKHAIQLKFTT